MKTYFFIFFMFLSLFSIKQGVIYAQNNKLEGLRMSTFDVDATPPVGSFLRYNQMINSRDMSLRAKGIVLLGASQPIVLVAMDWIILMGRVWMPSRAHCQKRQELFLNEWRYIHFINTMHQQVILLLSEF